MSEHAASIRWGRGEAVFSDNKYSRAHTWRFDGGVEVPASSSPQVVPPPLSAVAAVDPEEALVAALSSCHMLWFLAIAGKRGFVVDRYEDDALGTMGKNADGKLAIVRVVLRPRVAFVGERRPSSEQHAAMHHEAHERCYVANSVRSEVACEPTDVSG